MLRIKNLKKLVKTLIVEKKARENAASLKYFTTNLHIIYLVLNAIKICQDLIHYFFVLKVQKSKVEKIVKILRFENRNSNFAPFLKNLIFVKDFWT